LIGEVNWTDHGCMVGGCEMLSKRQYHSRKEKKIKFLAEKEHTPKLGMVGVFSSWDFPGKVKLERCPEKGKSGKDR